MHVFGLEENLVLDARVRQDALVTVHLKRLFGYAQYLAHLLVVKLLLQAEVFHRTAHTHYLFLQFAETYPKFIKRLFVDTYYFHTSHFLS